ncbi:hypothetical protein Tco_1217054 [Tanacetum coccineum]
MKASPFAGKFLRKAQDSTEEVYAQRHRRALEFQLQDRLRFLIALVRFPTRLGQLPPLLSLVHNVFHVSVLRGQSLEEQDDPFCQNFFEESSESGEVHLGDERVLRT